MSVNSVSSQNGAQNSSQLVQQLVSQIDANQDGQISSTELGSFLSTLLSAVSSTSKKASPNASANQTTAEATAGTDVLPSTWTDNNAPYGVTLAGFDPQKHTDLTLADLGTPGKAEKYAVYEYLVANKIQPTNSWATAAAQALNQKYNTTVYHAIDGETLGYGNEYVHTAPNGHGMAAGTYNPNASGEFLWGAVPDSQVV